MHLSYSYFLYNVPSLRDFRNLNAQILTRNSQIVSPLNLPSTPPDSVQFCLRKGMDS